MRKIVLIFLGIMLPILLWVVFQHVELQTNAAEPTAQDAQELTHNLLKKTQDYRKAHVLNKSAELAALKQLAQKRKDRLKKELQENPTQAVAYVLTKTELELLPQELKKENLVEKAISVHGKVTLTHYDIFAEKRKIEEYKFQTTDEQYTLFFRSGTAPIASLGSTVTVQGISLDSALILASPQDLGSFSEQNIPFTVEPVLGEVKIAAILLKFADDQRELFDRDAIRQNITGTGNTLASYYTENSLGKISVSANVFGYYTVPSTKPTTDCSYSWKWADEADQKALEAGVDLTPYKYRFYFFPIGTPENGYYYAPCISTAWASLPYSGFSYMRSWFTPTGGDAFTLTHEFGHNLGLRHANVILCDQGPIGSFVNNLAGCVRYEYGDYLDVMGSWGNRNLHHFTAIHKAGIGWFDRNQVQQVTQSGTYTISRLESNQPETKVLAISIPKSAPNEMYYIDYRQQVGFDQTLPQPATLGALIYLGDPYRPIFSTYLLDMHRGWPPEYNSASSDAAMLDGEQFVDSETGITITQLAHDSGSVTLRIDFTFNPTPTPTMTITDLKNVIANYLLTDPSGSFFQDAKQNMLDAGFIIKWLVQ